MVGKNSLKLFIHLSRQFASPNWTIPSWYHCHLYVFEDFEEREKILRGLFVFILSHLLCLSKWCSNFGSNLGIKFSKQFKYSTTRIVALSLDSQHKILNLVKRHDIWSCRERFGGCDHNTQSWNHASSFSNKWQFTNMIETILIYPPTIG